MGDIYVSSWLVVNGHAMSDVIVRRNGCFLLNGVALRNVVVEPGGAAIIRGKVFGELINLGGSVEVSGAIVGRVRGRVDTQLTSNSALLPEPEASSRFVAFALGVVPWGTVPLRIDDASLNCDGDGVSSVLGS